MPRAGDERIGGAVPMVYVPASEFTMGSDSGFSDEKSVHTVYLDGFWIDKYLVTMAEYERFLDASVRPKPVDWSYAVEAFHGGLQKNHPVVYICWDDAAAYARWASKRLPSEAEWEKAASWDWLIGVKYQYPWGESFDKSLLNSSEGGKRSTTPVGVYPAGASPYGALDMAGNVWEWVADWYDRNYYTCSQMRNPTGASTGEYRVLRGGAWDFDRRFARTAFRSGIYPPEFRCGYVGFRCAL